MASLPVEHISRNADDDDADILFMVFEVIVKSYVSIYHLSSDNG